MATFVKWAGHSPQQKFREMCLAGLTYHAKLYVEKAKNGHKITELEENVYVITKERKKAMENLKEKRNAEKKKKDGLKRVNKSE